LFLPSAMLVEFPHFHSACLVKYQKKSHPGGTALQKSGGMGNAI